jgi:hypothetical protein
MKIKIRSSEDQLVVYREKTGVFIYGIFLAIGCIAFGVTFAYVGKDDLFPLIFGSVFTLVGALILLGSPKYYRTMKSEGGAELLNANREGLSIAPILNMTPVKYAWADVSRIWLTEKLITKNTNEKMSSRNQAIVYFRRGQLSDNVNLIDRSRRQLWKSPKGYNIFVVDVPKGFIDHVKEALIRLSSSNSEISSFNNVFFDYVSDTERHQP